MISSTIKNENWHFIVKWITRPVLHPDLNLTRFPIVCWTCTFRWPKSQFACGWHHRQWSQWTSVFNDESTPTLLHGRHSIGSTTSLNDPLTGTRISGFVCVCVRVYHWIVVGNCVETFDELLDHVRWWAEICARTLLMITRPNFSFWCRCDGEAVLFPTACWHFHFHLAHFSFIVKKQTSGQTFGGGA